MKIVFIRYSHAAERLEWKGSDDTRPLSKRGVIRAERFAERIKKIYEKPDEIISSSYVRASQTAMIIASEFGMNNISTNVHLNPGMDFSSFKLLMSKVPSSTKLLFIVGHGVEMSLIIKELIMKDDIEIYFKKPSLIELEVDVSKMIGKIIFSNAYDEPFTGENLKRENDLNFV